MEVQFRHDPVIDHPIVAPTIVVIARMERHVDVAREVDEEGERLQPDIGGQALIGEDALVARNLCADAGPARAVLAVAVFLGDRFGLVMPGEGIGPAPAFATQAIGPDRRILDRRQRTVGRADLILGPHQPLDRATRPGLHIRFGDVGGDGVGVEPPGRRRLRNGHRQGGGENRKKAHQASPGAVSYCSITHSSLSEAAIQLCIQSCSHTASI